MIFRILLLLVAFVISGTRFISSLQANFERDIVSGDINSLKSLIETNIHIINSPEADQERDDLLLLAVEEGQTEMVDLLLTNIKVNAASNDNEAIRTASAYGDVDIVKLLLARPEVNPGAKANEALMSAARYGHTEIVRQILAHPQVNFIEGAKGALYLASEFNHDDIIKLLASDQSHGHNSIPVRALRISARKGNADLVRYILELPFFRQNRFNVDFIVMNSDLTSFRTFVEARYIFSKATIDRTLNIARANGRNDLVEYIESLITGKNILPPKPLFQMTDECGICLAKDSSFNGYMTACQHQFHAECLQQWFHSHNSCPMCRAAIV